MFLTKSYGLIIHHGGWHTTNPDTLRKEAQDCQEAQDRAARNAKPAVLLRRRGGKTIRLNPNPSSLKMAS